MPGKTKSEKGDGVNRILEDANSMRFWVHAYDDAPKSRLISRAPQAILLTLPDMRPGQWARPG